MIIRTSMAERAAVDNKIAVPRLSYREQKRLEHSKLAKKMLENVEEVIEETPVAEEVREEKVVAQPIEELAHTDVAPGTAIVRSKVLEELENSYRKEPE